MSVYAQDRCYNRMCLVDLNILHIAFDKKLMTIYN